MTRLAISQLSLVNEMVRQAECLKTLIEPQDWTLFQAALTLATMAAWLIVMAGHLQLCRYREHPRGPEKLNHVA